MIRLYLTISHYQREELKEHLWRNGYHVSWEDEDILDVDQEPTPMR